MASPVVPALLRWVLGLPEPVLRLFVGRPLRLDGQQLAASSQLLVRLASRTGWDSPDLAKARRTTERYARLMSAGAGPSVSARDITVAGADGRLPARLYVPAGVPAPSPLLVFLHGGGFAVGSVDSHDGLCRFLAEHAGVRVVSVGYRLAPEHPFPAAAGDVVAAFGDVVARAAELGTEPGLVAVGGDSAGGNLAAVVAHAAKPAPALSLLLYPSTDATRRHPSRDLFGAGFLLDDRQIYWYRDQYAPDAATHADPRFSILHQPDVAGLPPTYVITAGFDPLRDEGEAYAARLREAGVRVFLRRYPSLLHGFASLVHIDPNSRAAMHEIAGALRAGLALVHS